jgi:hypothetical protein
MVVLPSSALPLSWAVVPSLSPLHAVSSAQVTMLITKAEFFNVISVLWSNA